MCLRFIEQRPVIGHKPLSIVQQIGYQQCSTLGHDPLSSMPVGFHHQSSSLEPLSIVHLSDSCASLFEQHSYFKYPSDNVSQ